MSIESLLRNNDKNITFINYVIHLRKIKILTIIKRTFVIIFDKDFKL